jgi:hypothetical protein
MSYSFVEGQPEPAVPTSILIRPDGTIFGVRSAWSPRAAPRTGSCST